MCKAYKNQPWILNKQHSELILIYPYFRNTII